MKLNLISNAALIIALNAFIICQSFYTVNAEFKLFPSVRTRSVNGGSNCVV